MTIYDTKYWLAEMERIQAYAFLPWPELHSAMTAAIIEEHNQALETQTRRGGEAETKELNRHA